MKNYILLCRVTDEKSYSAGLYSWNGVKLAPESILMQYGYSVSATVDLSDKERHMILAALVDKGIVSKTGILSYLDFFISQRSRQTRYESAIAKWNNDKQFVMNYKNGAFMECDVDNLKL